MTIQWIITYITYISVAGPALWNTVVPKIKMAFQQVLNMYS